MNYLAITAAHTAPTGRFASMTASEVLAEQAALLARWSDEDTARRARNAALLASL